MKFEKAREQFVSALCGQLHGHDLIVSWPSEKVLDFLGTINDPMDETALEMLREELIEEDYPDVPGQGEEIERQSQLPDYDRPVAAGLTWAQAVKLIRKYISDRQNDFAPGLEPSDLMPARAKPTLDRVRREKGQIRVSVQTHNERKKGKVTVPRKTKVNK